MTILVMDLSFLIPSKIRRKVLEYFTSNPEAQISVRGLARELGESSQQTHRELINLENWGFLFSSKEGNQRMFRVNTKFPLYSVIDTLFERYQQEQTRTLEVVKVYNLDKHIKKLERVRVPKELLEESQEKRTKPRSYIEEKLLKRG